MNSLAHKLFAQAWAMEPRALRALIARIASINVSAVDIEARSNYAPSTSSGLDVRDGVAHIDIAGPMMKAVPWWFDFFDIKATSTIDVREKITKALESADVEAIQLNIDSPGGTVEGTNDLADDVYAAKKQKPINTYSPDMMASAAYWVGSQADKISIGPSAMIGSIGTFAVVDDYSKLFEEAGVKTHVVSNHELKGAFTTGSEITETQLEDLQRNVDTFTTNFINGVARGRNLPADTIRKSATGQVWIGDEAIERKLADEVVTIEETQEQETVPVETEHIEQTYAPAAQTEIEMETKTELEKLRAENAELIKDNEKLTAKAQVVEASLAESRQSQMDALIESNRDRISPAMLEKVKAFAATIDDVAELQDFINILPQVTNPTEIGQTPTEPINPPETASKGEKKIAKIMKLPSNRIKAIDELVLGAQMDGTFLIKDPQADDGQRIVTKQELKAILESQAV